MYPYISLLAHHQFARVPLGAPVEGSVEEPSGKHDVLELEEPELLDELPPALELGDATADPEDPATDAPAAGVESLPPAGVVDPSATALVDAAPAPPPAAVPPP